MSQCEVRGGNSGGTTQANGNVISRRLKSRDFGDTNVKLCGTIEYSILLKCINFETTLLNLDRDTNVANRHVTVVVGIDTTMSFQCLVFILKPTTFRSSKEQVPDCIY